MRHIISIDIPFCVFKRVRDEGYNLCIEEVDNHAPQAYGIWTLSPKVRTESGWLVVYFRGKSVII